MRERPTCGEPGATWAGNPRLYQREAIRNFEIFKDRDLLPWAFITTTCEVPLCLDPECMVVNKPYRINYLAEVCVYCGMGGYQRDHLLPEPQTGAALRHLVLTVPSCGECNRAISDLPTAAIHERRKVAQVAIERKNARLLLRGQKSEEELEGLGHEMRSVAIKNNALHKSLLLRLSWPDDPHYDLRAFQRSGIEDPAALGLCEDEATCLRPEYREAA